MKKEKKKGKFRSFPFLRAKLTFDDGYAENPIYLIKAITTEKDKGLDMVDLIRNNFNLTLEEIRKNFLKKLEEERKKIWTRDERGNITSPFRKELKKKDF